jgi:hypothetical protein
MIRTLALLLALAPGVAAAQSVALRPDGTAPYAAPAASPFEMIPARPAPSRTAFVAPTTRVTLDQPGRVDSALSFEAMQSDVATRRTARETDAMEGPLNGQWLLLGPSGEQLYVFQITSSLTKGEPPAGAWRNPRVARSSTSAGFIALLGYDGAQLNLRFTERSAQDLVAVNLTRDPAGRFSGQLTKDGATTPVVLQAGQ